MTRKDYEKIAAVIAGTNTAGPFDRDDEIYLRNSVCTSIAEGVADMLQADNPRFDREKFLKACGVE